MAGEPLSEDLLVRGSPDLKLYIWQKENSEAENCVYVRAIAEGRNAGQERDRVREDILVKEKGGLIQPSTESSD